MAYILVTNTNVQSVFSQNEYNIFDFQADVIYSGDLTLPSNSVLHFSGGSLTVIGNLVGNHSAILASPVKCLNVLGIDGIWDVDRAYPEWFGAVADGMTDCSGAINMSLMLVPSELHFVSGTYAISQSIVTHLTNIFILSEASINALCDVCGNVKYAPDGNTHNPQILTYHSMIIGAYPYPENGEDSFGLRVQPIISGGGCIDANGLAKTAIALIYGYRTHVTDLIIKNFLEYGFVSTIVEGASGSCLVQRCVFLNQLTSGSVNSTGSCLPAAINNNKPDCTFENIEIYGFNTGVVHNAENGVYRNMHIWRESAQSWTDTVAFHCLTPQISLISCSADNIRKFVQIWATVKNSNGFFANIINCRTSADISTNPEGNGEPIIIYKTISSQYPSLGSSTTIILQGGVFWYEIPFRIVNIISNMDKIIVTRYNRQELIS